MNNSKQLFKEMEAKISAIEKGLGFAETIKEAAKILGNPILAYDICYNLLDYFLEHPTDDPLCNELVRLRGFSHETVIFFNAENFIVEYDQADIVAFMHSDKLKYDRMNGKLFDKDTVQLGNIIVIAAYRPFVENEAKIIEKLCEKLSVELQSSKHYSQIVRVFGNSVLQDFLDGTTTDTDAVKNTLAEIFVGMKKNVYIAAADIYQFDGTITHIGYFKQMFEKIKPDLKCFVGLENIIVFLSTDENEIEADESFSELKDFFKKNRIYMGISSAIENRNDLKKYYREAINALNSGLQNTEKGNIFIFEK